MTHVSTFPLSEADAGEADKERKTRNKSGKGGETKAEEKRARSWVGKKKRGCETKKSLRAKRLLPLLFDISLPDAQQDARAMEFLHDTRTERKSRLPPLAEKAEEKKDLEQGERKKAAADQFRTVGL